MTGASLPRGEVWSSSPLDCNFRYVWHPRTSQLTGRTRLASLLAVAGLAQACNVYPSPPRYPADDPAFAETLDLRPEGMEDPPPEPIKVLPGDVLALRAISAEETVYEGLTIDELGNIHLPLAGDVNVAGMTLAEAEAAAQKALRRYDSVVRVSLQIMEPEGHRAVVVGAVGSPGAIVVRPGMRLAELLAMAGGPNQGGDENIHNVADAYAARLVREGEILPVSIPEALKGAPSHNIRVRAGDHLYVPPIRGDTITVLGEVAGPQVLLWREHLRLTQVLAQAGGIPITGRKRDVRVIRGRMDQPSIYKVSMRKLSKGKPLDIEMAPGDIVYVGRRSLAEMASVLGALAPVYATGLSVGVGIAVTR